MVLYEGPYGALTQLWAGTMPETLNYNGKVDMHVHMSLCTSRIADWLISRSSSFHGLASVSADRRRMTTLWVRSYGIGWRSKSRISSPSRSTMCRRSICEYPAVELSRLCALLLYYHRASVLLHKMKFVGPPKMHVCYTCAP